MDRPPESPALPKGYSMSALLFLIEKNKITISENITILGGIEDFFVEKNKR
jgi:hypothetical protein